MAEDTARETPSEREILVMPEAGIERLLQPMEQARSRIFLKIFELEKPRIIRALIDAHQRGVDVRVQVNRIRTDGSFMNARAIGMLRRAGVRVKWCNPRFRVTHEKSLVLDDTAYICSFNFCGRFFKRVRGYAVVSTVPDEVQEIVDCFRADWNRDEEGSHHDRLLWGGHDSRTRILELLDSAKETVDIQHKKLVDTTILERLIAAVQRGVRVRFLCSALRGVHGAAVYENAAAMRILKSVGGEVNYLSFPKVHAKLILIDSTLAKVGSINLAGDCFETRRELGIVLNGDVIEPLRATFESDWSHSVPWNPPDPRLIEEET